MNFLCYNVLEKRKDAKKFHGKQFLRRKKIKDFQ